MQNTRVSFYSIIVFLIATIFYLYEFALQISPSVMTESLMEDLQIGALGLGMLSSFYYYAYAPMQLAAGILYDRLGPRLLLGLAIMVCAVGAFLFAWSEQLWVAALGRILMGGGSAFAFVGTLVLVTRWFPLQYFAFLVGVAQFMGSAGAIVSEVPLAKATDIFGWRDSLVVMGVFGVCLAVIAWLVIRNWPTKQMQKKHQQAQEHVWEDLKLVLGQAQTWLTAGYAFLVWAPITAFAALWGVPFIRKIYSISSAEAGAAISMIWLGVALGCPILGWWSDKVRTRKPQMLFCASLGILSLLIVIYLPVPLFAIYISLFLFGVAAAGQSLSFGVVKDNNAGHTLGTAVGFNNMMIVAGGAMLQPLVGWILHHYWDGQKLHNIPVYSLADYKSALTILPISYILALLLGLFFLKESYRQLPSK